jgi:DMSO/TMAO reductase YedYZ molybdopterin-dependent catalytic subunit
MQRSPQPPRPPRERPKEVPRDGLPIGRAAFLATILAGVGGIAVAPSVASFVNGAANELPAGLGSLVPGGGWRIYSIVTPLPRFVPASYALRIHGEVENPVTLRWSEVAGLKGAKQVSTFHCVTGWSVSNVHWEGVRASTIAELVKPKPSARYVTFQSLEAPYVDQLTRSQFELSDTMLARHMNGKPVTREHGAPLRLVIPQMYGYKGVKWLSEIRYDSAPSVGFWEQRGYDVDAYIGRSNGL